MSASIASTSSLSATARSLRVSSGMTFSALSARVGAPGSTGRTLWREACVGPRARPLCHQRWVSAAASSTPRSEAQRRSQAQLVVSLAGVACLPGALESEHRIGAELPAGAGAHRALSGVPERHACVGSEHAAVAGEPEAVACVDRDSAVGLELGVRPERACIVREPEPLGSAPRAAPCRGDGQRQPPGPTSLESRGSPRSSPTPRSPTPHARPMSAPGPRW